MSQETKQFLFKLDTEPEYTCGSCLENRSNLYVLAESLDQALLLYNRQEAGLCGICISDMFVDGNYEIHDPNPMGQLMYDLCCSKCGYNISEVIPIDSETKPDHSHTCQKCNFNQDCVMNCLKKELNQNAVL